MYKKNAIMFWKAINGRDPVDCSEPIDLSKLTSDDDTHGTHAYLITEEVGKFDVVIGTVLDEAISWRMADLDEAVLILEYYRSSQYASAVADAQSRHEPD